jgi:hypothetical protein
MACIFAFSGMHTRIVPDAAIARGADDASHQLRGDATIDERPFDREGNFSALATHQSARTHFRDAADLAADEISESDVAEVAGMRHIKIDETIGNIATESAMTGFGIEAVKVISEKVAFACEQSPDQAEMLFTREVCRFHHWLISL